PMHPSVRSDRPGACPICGMDLVKIEKMPSSDTAGNENVIFIMPRQQKLANIKVEKAQKREISENNILLGQVVSDPRTTTVLTAKVPGRIEKLYIKNPHEKVFSGQAIYEIYCEELLVDQKEYLLSRRKLNEEPDNSTLKLMTESSKNKLLQWGMSQAQINQLEKRNSASARTTFFSPANGILQELHIREGQYVEIGTPIGSLVQLNPIWVEAKVYTQELKMLQTNPEVFIEAEGLQQPLPGKMVFKNPGFDENTRISLTRFEVKNFKQHLTPGMMVYVRLNSPGKNTIAIPKSAILPEQMPTVYVKIGDDAFERRMVKTGTENRNSVEILSGIKEGEKVVVSGAYLINSEFVLKKGGAQKHTH
ncbi:MAG: efflux RND transporter periplasmic adaptor subunit, partial [Bacteroidia bacterium]